MPPGEKSGLSWVAQILYRGVLVWWEWFASNLAGSTQCSEFSVGPNGALLWYEPCKLWCTHIEACNLGDFCQIDFKLVSFERA